MLPYSSITHLLMLLVTWDFSTTATTQTPPIFTGNALTVLHHANKMATTTNITHPAPLSQTSVPNMDKTGRSPSTEKDASGEESVQNITTHVFKTTESSLVDNPCTTYPPIPRVDQDIRKEALDHPTCDHRVDVDAMGTECQVRRNVPAGKVIRIKLCDWNQVHVRIWQFRRGRRLHPVLLDPQRPHMNTDQTIVIHSWTDDVLIVLKPKRHGVHGPTVSLAAVNESEAPTMGVSYFAPTMGEPAWGKGMALPDRPFICAKLGHIQFPRTVYSFVTGCVTLTPPGGHVLFLSRFPTLDKISFCMFVGQCGVETRGCRGVGFFTPVLFPDWSSSFQTPPQKTAVPMSMVFFCRYYYGLPKCKKFQILFSVHRSGARPVRVGRRWWNCSCSVWPGLHRHFPCDYSAQCWDGEDEADCPYTSKEYGTGYLEAGKKKIFLKEHPDEDGHDEDYEEDDDDYYDFSTHEMLCRRQGAAPVSFHSPQEWLDVRAAINHTEEVWRLWIDLHHTRLSVRHKDDVYIRNMYSNTWRWGDGPIAYFLHYSLSQDNYDCTVLTIRNFQDAPSEQVGTITSNCRALIDHWRIHATKRLFCQVPTPASAPRSHHDRIVLEPSHLNTTTTQSPVPLVPCPRLLHVTHAILACDPKSQCEGKLENRGLSFTKMCRMTQATQATPYFTCNANAEHVPYSLVCDWRQDCGDNSDESFCQFPPCGGSREVAFDCGQGQCTDANQTCDGKEDCKEFTDEKFCRGSQTITYFNVTKPPALVNFDRTGSFSLIALPQATVGCPETHFRCPGNGYCLPVYTRCNRVVDCPGHEDEVDCHLHTCPGLYRCRGHDRDICLHVKHLCDGFTHCPLHDDELMCEAAESCLGQGVCYGNRFFRHDVSMHLRYLEAKGTGLTVDAVMNYTILIHLGVGSCGWTNLTDILLPNLHVFDLSDNHLCQISFKHLAHLKNLKELVLSGNPLSSSLPVFSRPYKLTKLLLLNLSRVLNQTFNLPVFSNFMPQVQILDLSHSGVESLTGKQLFRSLRVFNLRGCPISDFSPQFMKGMEQLQHVFGDNFKLCCPSALPDTFTGKCVAPANEISSCDHLLKSSFYGIALAVFAVLALLGNLASFVYRARVFITGRNKVGYSIFVIHLSVSDFLMGVYLSVIGVADRLYAGSYLWNQTAWVKSVACRAAGFFSFLSCEVSSLVILLITLDRFLVIRFPFSRLRFGLASAHLASTVNWGLGVLLAAVPLLPVTSHWEFYSQTGICIPLPVTRADFPGRHYSFGVMIVVNLVLFLLTAAGQALVYWSVAASTMSDGKDSLVVRDRTRSKELIIARRLLVVAMSDFLCWFPIGVCGLLAKMDVAVSGEVNAAMATLVLPVNAALNPFLYTYTALLQKRQKQKEMALQKSIAAQIKLHLAASSH